MKKLLAIMIVFMVFASAAFAGGSEEAATTQEGGPKQLKDRVVIVNALVLQQLDLQNNNTSINNHSYEMTHNTLVAYDSDTGKILPELALSWEQPDDLTYIFKLRDDVTFQNGDKFTAADVIYTYARGMETSAQGPKLEVIESMEAADDYNLTIKLSQPAPEFLDSLAAPNLSIMNQKAVESIADDWGCQVGTGAYILKEWIPDDYALYERNENYWGEIPPTKEIKYQKMSEASARVIALQTGEADVCIDVPPVEAAYIDSDSNTKLLRIPSAKLVYIALNNSGYVPAFQDARVRAALNHATNQEELILLMREGFATTSPGIIPPAQWGYYKDVKGYEYNVDKAKALLKEAGYENLSISLWYDEATYPGLFEALQAMWAKAGVTLTLGTGDVTIMTTKVKKTHDFDVTVAKWSFTGINNAYTSLWNSKSGSNKTLTNDPTLDEMIVAAGSETNREKREALYAELSQYVTDIGAMIPMYVDELLIGTGKGVEGLKCYGNDRHVFTYVTAEK